MAQIAGRKLPQSSIPQQQYIFATIQASDADENGAMNVMVFGNPLGSNTIFDGDYTYSGECGRPGAGVSDPVWRMTRQYVDALTSNIEVMHAYVPAKIYKGAYADEAAIVAAYPVGEPGWNAYNEDTATYWIWDPFAGPAAWVDTASGDKIEDSPASYAGFDHAMTDYADLNYCY